MIASILLCGVALRAGLVLRRARRLGVPRPRNARAAHLRVAKPAVVAIFVGLVAGPVSAVVLRNWEPFGTFHSFLGLLAASLFAAAAAVGHRIEAGKARAFDAHALLGMLAMLAALIAGVAGLVLLP
jgi:hypothetical protein